MRLCRAFTENWLSVCPRLQQSPDHLLADLSLCSIRIAGMGPARERQVNVRVIPTSAALYESIDLPQGLFNRTLPTTPERIKKSRY